MAAAALLAWAHAAPPGAHGACQCSDYLCEVSWSMGFLPKGFGLRALMTARGINFNFLSTLWHCVLFIRLAGFLHIWQASTVRVQDISQ